jgi:hypothetical protein
LLHILETDFTPSDRAALSVLALALRPTDPAALHYRHLGCTIARQMQRGMGIKQILLDRARGYTIATSDPVTGGVHCSLGGDPRYDFLVTSTLASQGPQAVGRALAIEHLPQGKWPTDAISFVSCGDGSINNSEWLSAVNAAEYIEHRRRACPVLFAISDNGLSISRRFWHACRVVSGTRRRIGRQPTCPTRRSGHSWRATRSSAHSPLPSTPASCRTSMRLSRRTFASENIGEHRERAREAFASESSPGKRSRQRGRSRVR